MVADVLCYPSYAISTCQSYRSLTIGWGCATQVEGLPEMPGEHKKSKAATKAPKMKRIPSVQGIETDLAKAVRPPAPARPTCVGLSMGPVHLRILSLAQAG